MPGEESMNVLFLIFITLVTFITLVSTSLYVLLNAIYTYHNSFIIVRKIKKDNINLKQKRIKSAHLSSKSRSEIQSIYTNAIDRFCYLWNYPEEESRNKYRQILYSNRHFLASFNDELAKAIANTHGEYEEQLLIENVKQSCEIFKKMLKPIDTYIEEETYKKVIKKEEVKRQRQIQEQDEKSYSLKEHLDDFGASKALIELLDEDEDTHKSVLQAK